MRCLRASVLRAVVPMLSLLVLAAAPAARAATPNFAAARQRAAALVAQMTAAEKLGLIGDRPGPPTPSNPDGTIAIPRLGIPALVFGDGPNGVGDGATGVTAFPAAILLAAAFDPGLAQNYGTALAQEELGAGHNYVAAPTINVVRSPLWGRLPETFGSDPVLNGLIGAAEIRGIQSQHVIAQVKHYVAYDQEAGRLGDPAQAPADNVTATPAALYDLFAAPFHLAIVDGGAASVMCAYNEVNGLPACQSGPVLGALRSGLGFQGFVGNDADFAVRSTPAAANAGLDNFSLGSIGSLGGLPDTTALAEAVNAGTVTLAQIDTMATNIVTAIEAVGVHAAQAPRPGISTAAHRALAAQIAAEGAVLMKNAGTDPALPLSSSDRRIAVIGADAKNELSDAESGSPAVRGGAVVTPLAAISARAGGGRVSYAPGTLGDVPLAPAPITGLTLQPFSGAAFTGAMAARPVSSFALPPGTASGRWTGTITPAATGPQRLSLSMAGTAALWVNGREVAHGETETAGSPGALPTSFQAVVDGTAGRPLQIRVDYSSGPVPVLPGFAPGVALGYAGPDGQIAAAAAAARRASVAVVFAGDASGEGMDRSSLALPGDQDALIEAVAKANPRTIVVLNTAGPVLMPWRGQVAGIVEDWYPGQADGTAIARVLFGDIDPAGRLPIAFPGGEPAPISPAGSSVSAVPGDDGSGDAFPFGFGLSYTTFRLGGALRRGDLVTVPVTNTGHRPGTEVVELYGTAPAGHGFTGSQLKAFARVSVPPGATRTARIEIDPRALQVWNPGTGRYAAPAWRWKLAVGASAAATRPVSGA